MQEPTIYDLAKAYVEAQDFLEEHPETHPQDAELRFELLVEACRDPKIIL